MFRNLFEKGKCLVGLHLGEWHFESPNRCTQVRVCERCGVRSERVEHSWGDWEFVAAGHCDQVRICARCSEKEERVEHCWGAPHYREAGSCEEVRTCSRCRAEEADGPRHQWSGWHYDRKDDCTQHQVCSRCHARGQQSQVAHRWGEWQTSAYYGGPVRVCRQCGEMEKPEPQLAATAAVSGDAGRSEPAALGALTQFFESLQSSPPTPPAPGISLDSRLVGHWRHTHCMSGGGFSMVTDTHLVLAADGRFVRHSHTASGMGENRSPQEDGTWQSTGRTLQLIFDDGSESKLFFELNGDQLFLPQESHFRLWERV